MTTQTSTPEITILFLDKKQARLEFVKTDYLDQFNDTELNLRLSFVEKLVHGDRNSRVAELRSVYMDHCLTFNEQEKTTLRSCLLTAEQKVSSRTKSKLLLPSSYEIKLLKLDSMRAKLDWGYVFTINDTIVLPNNYITELLAANDLRLYTVTLYHEIIHIRQRNLSAMNCHYRTFGFVYENIWRFIPIKRSQILDVPDNINLITNPDGYNFEWIVKTFDNRTRSDVYFMPCLIYDRAKKIPVDILIELDPIDASGFYRMTNRCNYMNKVQEYTERFLGLTNQLHHPNEISAQLLSEYLVNGEILFKDGTYIMRYILSDQSVGI